jgi:hypothetical protein
MRDGPMETFMILDVESGNAVAFFDNREEAEASLHQLAEEFADRADDLAVVTLDKEGFALDTQFRSDLLQLA